MDVLYYKGLAMYSITRDFVLITGDVMNYKGCFILAGDFVYYVIFKTYCYTTNNF